MHHLEQVAGAEPVVLMLERAESKQHEDLADDREDEVEPDEMDHKGIEKVANEDTTEHLLSGNGPSDDVFRGQLWQAARKQCVKILLIHERFFLFTHGAHLLTVFSGFSASDRAVLRRRAL